MDLALLRRLAEGGSEAVPVDQFRELSNWCWDWSEASGDARFCSLARALGSIDSWYSEHDAVPRHLANELEQACLEDLPPILEAGAPADAAILARGFRQRVEALLLPADQWGQPGQ